MKRLHAVVEGHGDVEALPCLLGRVLGHLGRRGWSVNKTASRLPRTQLVDATVPSPLRPPLQTGIARSIGVALAARATAVVIVVDADDDCPRAFGPEARSRIEHRLPAAAVMAVCEFETWLLLSFSAVDLRRAGVRNPTRRDAKSELRKLVPGYAPTIHQLDLARQVDIERLRRASDSFDKLVRDVDRMTC